MRKTLLGLGVLICGAVGAIVGAIGGHQYFANIPPTYTAQGLLQIVDSQPVGGRQNQQNPNTGKSDYSRVMRSRKVLGDAVDKGRLSDYSEFRGMDRDAVIMQLMTSKKLRIERVKSTSIQDTFILGYSCGDPELSAVCINSIVDSFREFCAADVPSQIAVEELNKANIGVFSGPWPLKYLAIGSAAGISLAIVPAFLLALLVLWHSDRINRPKITVA